MFKAFTAVALFSVFLSSASHAQRTSCRQVFEKASFTQLMDQVSSISTEIGRLRWRLQQINELSAVFNLDMKSAKSKFTPETASQLIVFIKNAEVELNSRFPAAEVLHALEKIGLRRVEAKMTSYESTRNQALQKLQQILDGNWNLFWNFASANRETFRIQAIELQNQIEILVLQGNQAIAEATKLLKSESGISSNSNSSWFEFNQDEKSSSLKKALGSFFGFSSSAPPLTAESSYILFPGAVLRTTQSRYLRLQELKSLVGKVVRLSVFDQPYKEFADFQQFDWEWKQDERASNYASIQRNNKKKSEDLGRVVYVSAPTGYDNITIALQKSNGEIVQIPILAFENKIAELVVLHRMEYNPATSYLNRTVNIRLVQRRTGNEWIASKPFTGQVIAQTKTKLKILKKNKVVVELDLSDKENEWIQIY